jgi:Ca-activated chloride channel family protein
MATPLAAQDGPGLVGGAAAQNGGSSVPMATRGSFKSAVELVTLNVTVTDGRSHHVAGLNQNDFQVLEDGVPQDVTFFAAGELPLDVALLVDTSSSMRDKMDLVQEAAEGFVRTLRPGDRGSVVEFNERVHVLQGFTGDKALLASAVRRTSAHGSTALYGAIYVTLDQFVRSGPTSGEIRRPAIVVLTDGEDTASLIQFDDLLDRARRSGVAIYTIAAISPYEAKKLGIDKDHRFYSQSDYALKTLAQETGARSFFPLELAELNGVYQAVADELTAQYALGYTPKAPGTDGTYHRLLVKVLTRPEARSRTRTGYYSAGPAHASLLAR